jgi:hypothetical protein
MLLTNILEIAIPFIFFLTNIVWTQKIYNGRRLLLYTILSLLLPVTLFYFIPETSKVEIMNLSLLLFYYFILLLTVKKIYKKVNHFFIQKNLIAISYNDKDFTYVQWSSLNPTSPDWWDEKRARKPSWLDYLLTYMLLAFPFLAFTGMYMLTKKSS